MHLKNPFFKMHFKNAFLNAFLNAFTKWIFKMRLN
jgi:hypothetical protein